MDGSAVRGVRHWKMNRPWQSAFLAVTTASHQTSDSPEGVPEGDTRRHHIRDFPKRQFIFPTVQNRSERSAHESAVKNQAAAANRDDVIQRLAREFVIPVTHDVPQTRADDRAENDPGREVHDGFFGKILARSPPAARPERGQKTNGGKNAVPINR